MQVVRISGLVYQAVMAVVLGGGIAVIGFNVMPYGAWLGLIPFLAVMWFGLRRPLRRWQATRTPLSSDRRAWLEAHLPFYARLEAGEKRRFERDVQILLEEWTFEGVAGVDVYDSLRLGVTAGAALLLHGRPDWELAPRQTILFYPAAFDEDYYNSDYADFEGMAHLHGPVILSKPAVEQGWAHPEDGNNVVLHELAHLFDFQNAYADGAPALMDPASARAWGRLVSREMQRVRLGKSLLRRYASTNPAEFFSVAVENFFERPEALRRMHPEVYQALAQFFNIDLLKQ